MKIYLFMLMATLFISCGVKISVSESRLSNYIEGESGPFIKVMKHGEILAEDTVMNHRVVVVREIPEPAAKGQQVHVFDEEFKPISGGGFKRRVNVHKIADFGQDKIDFSVVGKRLLGLSYTLANLSCNLINSSGNRNFSVFTAAGVDTSSNSPKYFSGIFIHFMPCSASRFIITSDSLNNLPANEGYRSSVAIPCIPPDFQACKLLAEVKNGSPVWWVASPTDTTAKKKDTVAQLNGTGDSLVVAFNYACGKKFNFLVRVVSSKKNGDGTVYIVNNLEKQAIKIDSSKVTNRNLMFRQTELINQKDMSIKVGIDSSVIKSTDTVIYKSTPILKLNAYTYSSSFDNIQFNYFTELKRLYPAIEDACARDIILLISQELFRHDTALIKFKYNADTGVVKTKTDTSAKKAAAAPGPVHSGSVSLIPLAPIIMEPVYSSTSLKNDRTLSIRLHLEGAYDSTANQVTFTLLDTTLSNKFSIYYPTKVITKENWERAVSSNGGIYDLTLHIATSSMKDSLENLQKGYLVIKGDSVNPHSYQELQLRSFNPNKPFWVEFGSNFDLLNGLQANNLYGGIFMYKKDVAKWQRSKKPNISIIGGVYESKTVSVDQAQNFANFQYLDNQVFSPLPIPPSNSYQLHMDTGTVTKMTSINNLGLFISPQVRLTNGSAEANGLHVFLAAWIELVWQRATTTFDYSKTAQVDSVPVPAASIGNYTYKPTTIQGDFRSHYFGLGLPIYLKEGYDNLYLNSVIGLSNQPGLYTNYNDSTFRAFTENVRKNLHGNIPWLPFYLFQFRLNEEKYGISFTGEIRGTIARSYKPFVTLALSKKFDLSKLLEFK